MNAPILIAIGCIVAAACLVVLLPGFRKELISQSRSGQPDYRLRIGSDAPWYSAGKGIILRYSNQGSKKQEPGSDEQATGQDLLSLFAMQSGLLNSEPLAIVGSEVKPNTNSAMQGDTGHRPETGPRISCESGPSRESHLKKGIK